MTTAAVIQARTGSTRLPGKVLLEIAGRPMLEWVVRRVQAARRIDVVCVATTTRDADGPVAERAASLGAEVFRGSEEDVLSRYVGAARRLGADLVVRVTSDCPLLDPGLIDGMLERRAALVGTTGPVDYYSNTLRRTHPRGLDVEIVTRAALERAEAEATDPRAREHVTWHLYAHPREFRLASHEQEEGRDDSGERWTVDTPEDLEFVRRVVQGLGGVDSPVSWRAVLAHVMAHPDLRAINAHVEQKEVRAGPAPTVLLRADASPEIGLGHVARCVALAGAIRRRGGTPVLVTRGDLGAGLARRAGVEIVALEGRDEREDARATIRAARGRGPAMAVVDHYGRGPVWWREVHGAMPLAAIDDVGRKLDPETVDVAINQNAGASATWYQGVAERLCGPRYALLREAFLARRAEPAPSRAELSRVVVTLGGSDPGGHTARAVRAVLRAVPGAEVDVIVGPGLRDDPMPAGEPRVRLRRSPEDVAAILGGADLAVCAAGSTLYECACLGVPAVAGAVAENQVGIARALARAGTIVDVGPWSDVSDADLERTLAELAADPSRREALAGAGRELVDGRGADRVAAVLETRALAPGRTG